MFGFNQRKVIFYTIPYCKKIRSWKYNHEKELNRILEDNNIYILSKGLEVYEESLLEEAIEKYDKYITAYLDKIYKRGKYNNG